MLTFLPNLAVYPYKLTYSTPRIQGKKCSIKDEFFPLNKLQKAIIMWFGILYTKNRLVFWYNNKEPLSEADVIG